MVVVLFVLTSFEEIGGFANFVIGIVLIVSLYNFTEVQQIFQDARILFVLLILFIAAVYMNRVSQIEF